MSLSISRRGFLATGALAVAGALCRNPLRAADADEANATPDFARWLQPVPERAVFRLPGYHVWCGSMVRGADGTCHLYYSRWRVEEGFNAWVTHSEIAHAVADDPLGPYRHVDVALPARGSDFWDGHCTHNPTVFRHQDKYYLYYMGNRGDRRKTAGLNWSHRNHQRIGVAVADNPAGPWVRQEDPLIEPTPGFHDALLCTNPAVTTRPDGSLLLIYKAVGATDRFPSAGR